MNNPSSVPQPGSYSLAIQLEDVRFDRVLQTVQINITIFVESGQVFIAIGVVQVDHAIAHFVYGRVSFLEAVRFGKFGDQWLPGFNLCGTNSPVCRLKMRTKPVEVPKANSVPYVLVMAPQKRSSNGRFFTR